MFECLVFVLVAGFIGVLAHYLHPIELDGCNSEDASWHRANHTYRRMHHE
jgi:hypothetical protein